MSTPASRIALQKGYDELDEKFPEPETLRLQEYTNEQNNPITAEEAEQEIDDVRENVIDEETRFGVLEDRNAYKSNPGVLTGERTEDVPEIYHYKADNRDLLRGFQTIPANPTFYGIPTLLAPPAQQNRPLGRDWGRRSDETKGFAGTFDLFEKNFASVVPVIQHIPNPYTA